MSTSSMFIVDGKGSNQSIAAEVNPQGIITPHSAPEIAGAVVSLANPMPTTDPAAEASLAAIATAQGAGGTGISEPTGGSGVLGFLSGIYKAITGTLAISAASLPLPAGAAQETGGNLATTAAETTATATALGTPADGVWSGTGSSSVIAALKAIWTALTSAPLPAGTNNIGSTTPGVATYNAAITITASVTTASAALTSTIPGKRLDLFNNSTAGTLWVSPSGGTAVAGHGIPIGPGAGYAWVGGLSAIPTGISDNGTLAISGAAG